MNAALLRLNVGVFTGIPIRHEVSRNVHAGGEGSREPQYRLHREAACEYGEWSFVYFLVQSEIGVADPTPQELHDSDFGKREEIHRIKNEKRKLDVKVIKASQPVL